MFKKVIEKDGNVENISSTPFLSGRPERDSIISNEDIINLKIALETAKTIDEFIKLV